MAIRRSITISVGARAQPSLRNVLKPLTKGSQDARKAAEKAMGETTRATIRETGKRVSAEQAAQQKMVREHTRTQGLIKREKERGLQAELRTYRERERAASAFHRAEIDRMRRESAEARKAKKDAQEADRPRSHRRHLAYDFGRRGVNNMHGLARGSARFAGDLARGAGVQLDPSFHLSKSIELDKMARDIALQGFQGSRAQGAAAVLQDPDQIRTEARNVALASGQTPEDVMAGLGALVERTGDLEQARKGIEGIAKAATSSGSEIEHFAGAIGEIYNALPNDQRSMDNALNIANVLAAQGKLGAVEMKDLAKGGAKLASSVPQYVGDPNDIFGTLGALAQLSRSSGGAASPTEALNSIARMTTTFKTGARVDAFKKLGVDVIDKDTNKIRDPVEIIKDTLRATKGDPMKFNKAFMNIIGAKPAEALGNIYKNAGAGEAGIKAVEDELNRLKQASMGAGDSAAALQLALDGDAAKANELNIKLGESADRLADKLVPAIEKLTPHIIDASEALVGLVEWAGESPGEVIAAAIAASIGQAALGTTIRALLEKAFFRNAPVGTLSAPGGPVGKGGKPMLTAGAGGAGGAGMSNLGAGLTIMATAVTVAASGVALIDAAFDEKEQIRDRLDSDKRISDEARARGAIEAIDRGSRRAQSDTDFLFGDQGFGVDLEALKRREKQLAADVARGEEGGVTNIGGLSGASAALNYITAGSVGTSADAQALNEALAQKLDANKAELAEVKAAIQKMSSGTLNVHVTNPPTPGAPPPDGRTGPF